jgi:hypothetical protein
MLGETWSLRVGVLLPHSARQSAEVHNEVGMLRRISADENKRGVFEERSGEETGDVEVGFYGFDRLDLPN